MVCETGGKSYANGFATLSNGRKSSKFTWQDLAELNTRENAHIAVRGKVYDVHEFADRHPGGVEQILFGAGRDCTQLFDSYHPLSTSKLLEKFYVGELISNELPVFPEPSKFHVTVKERVNKYFKDHKINPKLSFSMIMVYLVILSMVFSAYSAMLLLFSNNLWGLVPLAIFHGFWSALCELTLMHDASHFAITRWPIVWSLVLLFNCCLNGNSGYVWVYQHVLGHHPYTNIDGADPDIVTTDEPADFRRIKSTQNWISRYFYQHIYAPMLYAFLAVKTRLQDFTIVYSEKRNGSIRLNPMSTFQFIMFWAGKIGFCAVRYFIPLCFMSLTNTIIMNVISDAVMSYWLAFTFQASHVVSEVEWPIPDKENKIHRDWAELQCTTTQDYATSNFIWNITTGHLNHQTAHHLFPGFSQYHYAKITPIVHQACKEFGVDYHCKDTFTEGVGAHVNHLKRLGQDVKKTQ